MRVHALIIGMLLMLAIMPFSSAQAADENADRNEADVLDDIILHSFEHFDYLDILFKLKGHNSNTWIVLFYMDEDHHKSHRDDVKRLIFGTLSDEEKETFRYAEANISKPNYSPITQAIRFPQHATEQDFPMILIMRDQVGEMVYGPGVARKAADVIEERRQADAEAAAAAANGSR